MQWVLVAISLMLAMVLVAAGAYGYAAVRNRVPFVVLPAGAVQAVVAALALRPSDCLYDLGCGDGRVLAAARIAEPGIWGCGVENNLAIWALARWRLGPAVQVVYGDILSQDLSRANRIFTYLGPEMMQRLEAKFARELAPGTRVVSVQFPMERPALQTLDLPGGAAHARRLYVYEF